MAILSVLSTMLKSAMGGKPGNAPYPTAQGWQGQGNYGWDSLLPSTRVDYQAEAGDLTENTAIAACLQWITRTFPEAPIQVKRGDGATAKAVPHHPLTTLIARPNPYYSGILLWQATLASIIVSGNGYWLKVRSGRGDVVQLWYEPHFTCGPVWPRDGSQFISGYQINRGGTWYPVKSPDVVHFRDGIDPQNTRLGLSRLASALREVYTDNEAANYSATILRNMGIPGLVVSPASSGDQITDPMGLKRDIMAKTTGDRRGEPLVSGLPIKIERIAWNPSEMDVTKARRIPEERVSALIGIPAVVAGLGVGLDHSTYSNMQEAREAAYESCIVPTQRLLASELDVQLLPDLGDVANEKVSFDLSQVRALQEDKDALYKRVNAVWTSGLIMRSEGRAALDSSYLSTPEDDIYRTDLLTMAARVTEQEPAGTLISDDPDITQPSPDDSPPLPQPSKNGHVPVAAGA